MLNAQNLLSRLADLDAKAEHVYDIAAAANDLRACLGAIREARGVVEAYGRLGSLADLEQRLVAALTAIEGRDQ